MTYPITDALIVMQLNVKGWTFAKHKILQNLTVERSCLMVLIQETHKTDKIQLKLDGYVLADFIPSKHHGIATFV